MILTATGLIVLGGLTALLGLRLITVLLPILGFVAGVMVGFSGVQALFGTGAFSIGVAIVMALIIGVIMAILSYLFYGVGIMVLSTTVGASIAAYLGLALGLDEAGFVLFLLTLAGAIMGFVFAAKNPLGVSVAISVTSLVGVSFAMAGIMLLVGEVSLDQLQEGGIIRTMLDVVDQELIWLLVLIGGALFAANAQTKTSLLPPDGRVKV